MPPSGKIVRFLLIALAIMALGGLIFYLTRPQPREVELATVKRGPVEATVVNTRAGTVKSCRRARLAPATGGRIVGLWVKEGERVRKGQALLAIWNADVIAQRDLARRQLATAGQRRREACIVAEGARREAGRFTALAARGYVSAQQGEDAETQARSREAACAAATAEVKSAQAQIALAETGLERTVLVAPFAGIVARVSGEQGEYATPSPPGIPTPPAVDLIDDSCLYVSAPMDEVDAPRLTAGQPVRISLDALPGRVFAGRLRRIAPYVTEVEKQARTVEVEADFDGRLDHPLLVGYSADVEVLIERRDGVLRLPTQAVQPSGLVLALGAGDRLEERRIKTGLGNWAWTEIKSGLAAGDRVLVSLDQEGIKAGARVRPKTVAP